MPRICTDKTRSARIFTGKRTVIVQYSHLNSSFCGYIKPHTIQHNLSFDSQTMTLKARRQRSMSIMHGEPHIVSAIRVVFILVCCIQYLWGRLTCAPSHDKLSSSPVCPIGAYTCMSNSRQLTLVVDQFLQHIFTLLSVLYM